MHFRHLTCVISFTRAISLSSAFPSAFPSALVLPRADPDPGTLAAAYQDSNSSDYTPAELSGSKRLRTRDDDQAFTSAGNGTNFLSVTFPDVGDEPGVTINLESAFNAKRQVGFYQFFNGTTTRVATFGEIFDDINAASPRVVTSHVKTALLHLEDKFLDFYGAAKFECGWNSGPGRKLTQDNRGGHISLAIVKAATGGAVASAFYYAGITPNATLGERAVVAGGSFMMGSIIGSVRKRVHLSSLAHVRVMIAVLTLRVSRARSSILCNAEDS